MYACHRFSQRRAEIEAFEPDTRTPQRARRELNVVVVGSDAVEMLLAPTYSFLTDFSQYKTRFQPYKLSVGRGP